MRIYRALLRLYPYDYRVAFEAEMLDMLRAEGLRWTELLGLARGAAAEWIAKLTTDRAERGRCLPDLRMMRPAGVAQSVWFRGT